VKTCLCKIVLSGVCAVSWVMIAAAVKPARMTFNNDVAPIIFKRCAECHHPNGPAPFSLLTFREVQKRAGQIAAATSSRYMPPWLPEPGYGNFESERRLSEREIATIREWNEQGAAEGTGAPPVVPEFKSGWRLGAPDMIVQMAHPFTLPPSGGDVFRNFVIPVPLTGPRYVRAIEILPDNPKVVHHANLLIDREQSLRHRASTNPELGFDGMDVSIGSSTFDPDSHFLFWKPGSAPAVEPADMAWRIDPRTDLVLNLHLQPTGKPESIRASIGLYFSDQPPSRFPMLLQLQNDRAIDIPAGTANFAIEDQFQLPVDVELLGIYPHAHYLGRVIEGYATFPNGSRTWLIRIGDWNMAWQGVFRYAKPVLLPRGATITMRIVYDNSASNPRNPNHPPARVTAGNRSVDEMGHLWIQVLARGPGDQRMVLQESFMRQRLKRDPSDEAALLNLGGVLEAQKRPQEALTFYEELLRRDPGNVVALNGSGVSLQATGQLEKAAARYREALRIRPDDTQARYNLANVLLGLGNVDEGLKLLRELARLQPEDAGAQNSLGSALLMKGEVAEAIVSLKEAARIDPGRTDAHSNLGYAFATLGQFKQAEEQYREVLRLNPKDADAHNELGVLLAREGKLADAISHFESALKIDPSHDEAAANLRRARAQLQRSN
jgi:Tfp pilus assembly protein PilF